MANQTFSLGKMLTRRGATAALTAAASIGALALMPQSATAQPIKGSRPCDGIKDHIAAIQCEVTQSKLRTKESAQRTQESAQRTEQNLAVVDCTNFLLAGIKAGSFTRAAMLAKADGKVTDANACVVARGLGFGRKAEASAPRLN
jgi:hypothetical protein